MRVLAMMFVAALLAACASTSGGTDGNGGDLAPLPFPVQRGSALPPPTPASTAQAVPPQGAGPGGIDFGQWRSADPAIYAPAFQSQVRTRYANQANAAIRRDLEANGFACEDGSRLECRIEIMQQQCAHDWYVVVERAGSPPIAGYDTMCLGAR